MVVGMWLKNWLNIRWEYYTGLIDFWGKENLQMLRSPVSIHGRSPLISGNENSFVVAVLSQIL
jgi:hypothetical protein